MWLDKNQLRALEQSKKKSRLIVWSYIENECNAPKRSDRFCACVSGKHESNTDFPLAAFTLLRVSRMNVELEWFQCFERCEFVHMLSNPSYIFPFKKLSLCWFSFFSSFFLFSLKKFPIFQSRDKTTHISRSFTKFVPQKYLKII